MRFKRKRRIRALLLGRSSARGNREGDCCERGRGRRSWACRRRERSADEPRGDVWVGIGVLRWRRWREMKRWRWQARENGEEKAKLTSSSPWPSERGRINGSNGMAFTYSSETYVLLWRGCNWNLNFLPLSVVVGALCVVSWVGSSREGEEDGIRGKNSQVGKGWNVGELEWMGIYRGGGVRKLAAKSTN